MKTNLQLATDRMDWPDECFAPPRDRLPSPPAESPLVAVGRDIAAFAPDLHREFADESARCETDGDRAIVAARWEQVMRRERRRASGAEGRE